MAYLVELEDKPIRVTARGAWLHGDEPLHPKVERLFQENVALDENGAYILQLQWRKAALEVADTAYFVRSSHPVLGPSGDLMGVDLVISDGCSEQLNPESLMQSAENVLYCRVKRFGHSLPCRFKPAQYHELALLADIDEAGAFVTMGGKARRISPYDPQVHSIES